MPQKFNNYEYVISACLLGIPCKWNKKSKLNEKALSIFLQGKALAICPEIAAEQPTPRPACEIIDGDGLDVLAGKARIIDKNDNDYSKDFIKGAEIIYNNIVKKHKISKAILKQGSPSCGVCKIFSGEFNGKKKNGMGVFTALLKKNNINDITEL